MSMNKLNLNPNVALDPFNLKSSTTLFGQGDFLPPFLTTGHTPPDFASLTDPSFNWNPTEANFEFVTPQADLPATTPTEGDDARHSPAGTTEGHDARWAPVTNEGNDGRWADQPTVKHPTYGDDTPDVTPIKCEDFPAPVKPTYGDDGRESGDTGFAGPCQGPADPVAQDVACIMPEYIGSVRPDSKPGTTPELPNDTVVTTEVVCVMPGPGTPVEKPVVEVVTDIVCVMPTPTPEKVVEKPVQVVVTPTTEVVTETTNDVTKTSPELPIETGVIVCDPPTEPVVEPTKDIVTGGITVCVMPTPTPIMIGSDKPVDISSWFNDDTFDFGGPCQGPAEIVTGPVCVFPEYVPSVRPDYTPDTYGNDFAGSDCPAPAPVTDGSDFFGGDCPAPATIFAVGSEPAAFASGFDLL